MGTLAVGDAGVELWVFRDEGLPVAVIEPSITAVTPGRDVRAEGLWLSITEESAGHWSVGTEAFGLELDNPDDVFGIPVAVGLDLEWEDDPDPEHCRVSGQVLVGDATYEVDGRGQRVT